MKFELKEITENDIADMIKTIGDGTYKGTYKIGNTVLIVDCYGLVWSTLDSFNEVSKMFDDWGDYDLALDALSTSVAWHREDGPAYMSSSGHQEWWVNNEEISKVDFCAKSKNGRKFKADLDKVATYNAWTLFTPVEITAAKMDKYLPIETLYDP